MSENRLSYKNIFRTTFLFGFVQVFNIIVKVILNKVVALLLGAEGIGIIGIYNTAINLIKTGAGLGISQSAVRDISEANASENEKKFSQIITITKQVIKYTALLGIIITIILSPYLSQWYFGDQSYILAFIWISIVVALNIMSDGQLAILKGMRQLKGLAKASIYGSLIGLIAAVPFYYFLGRGGIIPSLIVTALSSLFFSNYYVRGIKYLHVKLGLKEILKGAKSMIKMGIALMLVSFVSALFDMVIAAYINNIGSLADVGYYNAGATIITGYFGIVITSMSTDYYPRISAVYNDNEKLSVEMNRQSETGLIMIFPLVILFIFLSPFFIDILYSEKFADTNNYTDYAMIGTIIIVVSNCMGMILLAKQASNIFIWSVILQRLLLLGIYIYAYKLMGLKGLGFSYICTGVIHLLTMSYILMHFYKIYLSKRVAKLLLLVIGVTVASILFRKIDDFLIRYMFGGLTFICSCIFSLMYLKKYMDLNIISFIKNKIIHK